MNGAQSLIRSLADAGVDVCFANPGTSEMHLVAALDQVPEMRAVLCLFEGVVTGAADGYGRMAGRPAVTLLHLGPGLGNGLANLHNARRASTPLVNVVGDNATYHKRLDAPLESDIDSVAATVSGWLRRTAAVDDLAADAADAVAAALSPPGRIATLILPADMSWTDVSWSDLPAAGTGLSGSVDVVEPAPVAGEVVAQTAAVLRSGEPAALLIGGAATRGEGLRAASRIAAATGAKLLCETFPARLERGAGVPEVERLAYLAEAVAGQLAGVRHLVLAGAASPVSFFAYPGVAGDLVPEGCQVHILARGPEDLTRALTDLAERTAAGTAPQLAPPGRPSAPSGPLTAETMAYTVGALLPERAIVVDESNTSGPWLPGATAGAPPHDWLTLTGGAIGQGLPVATGAAVACPDRPVVCLESDGSAMYTISALWTQAHQGLDVTTVVLSNGSYAILNMELRRVGAGEPGPKARELLDLSRPGLDFVSISRGMGVPGERAVTAEEFGAALGRALAEPGPHLIEAVVPPLV
ncbi:acetolactate synthase large subunit [Streptantibioticus ferralitis]|uniref:Acetolactate synthase large subunit n=1 Tax=Streptantibioticus ferralitis TaxID=236510 RepID=A0ABT5YW60_9ACTN|nr:acetolactate synthase large subunit [Streptantibioticus ferralitis]MDF2255822.1 acetolactate synthase large subunit [Streptantibioticus ferralitis]